MSKDLAEHYMVNTNDGHMVSVLLLFEEFVYTSNHVCLGSKD